jgi:hypothetical protein
LENIFLYLPWQASTQNLNIMANYCIKLFHTWESCMESTPREINFKTSHCQCSLFCEVLSLGLNIFIYFRCHWYLLITVCSWWFSANDESWQWFLSSPSFYLCEHMPYYTWTSFISSNQGFGAICWPGCPVQLATHTGRSF